MGGLKLCGFFPVGMVLPVLAFSHVSSAAAPPNGGFWSSGLPLETGFCQT